MQTRRLRRNKVGILTEVKTCLENQLVDGNQQIITKNQALTAAREERRELAAKQEALNARLEERLTGTFRPWNT